MHLDFNKFKDWALLGLLAWGVSILWQLNQNVADLNTKIAVIIKEQETAKREIIDHEARLRGLEKRK